MTSLRPNSWLESLSGRALDAAERGVFPDALVRLGIRAMLAERVHEMSAGSPEAQQQRQRAFVDSMRRSPLALVPDKANDQHYEVPAAFFEHVLGPRLKYSSGYYPAGVSELADAEDAMLRLTCERAGLEDGMRVLDLGCGWGSLSLWIAEHYPACDVLGVSNSKTQAEYIRQRSDLLGGRVRVATADLNRFEPGERFDRVISIEMFEHMRNWQLLLLRIACWLEPDGRLFAHFFCHKDAAYPYESRGSRDWMAEQFFSGGMMPSDALILEFQDDLQVESRWRVNGLNYHRTCESWLRNLDARRDAVRTVLAEAVGEAAADVQVQRWRLFFLACSELFRYRGGSEWGLSHVRLAARGGH